MKYFFQFNLLFIDDERIQRPPKCYKCSNVNILGIGPLFFTPQRQSPFVGVGSERRYFSEIPVEIQF